MSTAARRARAWTVLRMRAGDPPKRAQGRGYTYLALLLAIALIGMAMAGAGTLWSARVQRDKERELLKVGHKIRAAIGQYYNLSPGPVKRYPPTLEALLRDDRFPKPQRYLREIYRDPMTETGNWGIVEATDGGILGVHSLSERAPRKTSSFAPADALFEGRLQYSEWVFAYLPEG